MNFELTLNRMAKKHGFDYKMQPMAYNARRAVIPAGTYNQLEYIESVVARVKGLRASHWCVFDGGFEGYVYIMESSEYDRYKAESEAENARHWDWWERYHIADAKTKRLMACGAIA